MKFLRKTYNFVTSLKMVKIVGICLLTLSAGTAFSQSSLIEEDPNLGNEEYEYYDSFVGGMVTKWEVARHIHSLWTIWAVDKVTANITTGLSVNPVNVFIEGLSIGTFVVNAQWGYGSNLGSYTSVGVSCGFVISFTGFPPINGNYTRTHSYEIK